MRLPIKKILCPIDFSDCSYDALDSAVELASHFSAELCLTHIVPEMPRPVRILPSADKMEEYDQRLSDYEEALTTSTQQKLHEVIVHRLPDGLSSHAIAGHGDAANEIVRIADEEKVDLIVMATHSVSDWREIGQASVTTRVVQLSSRPVLTIRAHREEL